MRNIRYQASWQFLFTWFTEKKVGSFEKPMFESKRQFLCFLALAGFWRGVRTPITGESCDFDSRLLEDFDSQDTINMIALVEFGDPQQLVPKKMPDDKKDPQNNLASMFEEYVNTGCSIIDQWLKEKPSDSYR
jgi:hypothetical protein